MSLSGKEAEPVKRGLPEEPPGLPGLRTWRGVYGLVLAVFAAVVLGLVWFGLHFT